jgi:16S rRNA (uracil1498-N3)-methyltransferase
VVFRDLLPEMSMRRFLAPGADLSGDSLTIDGDLYGHLVRVLRLASGDSFILADGRGNRVEAEMGTVHRGSAVALVRRRLPVQDVAIGGPAITIYHALPKGDKLDLIIEKGTELGAAAFVVFIGERSVARPDRTRIEGRLERWRRIALEAARQCGRSDVPGVVVADSLKEALNSSHQEVKLILWEEERAATLGPILREPPPASVGIVIGPEGGLSGEEVAAAQAAGYRSVSLGPRILRTETAGFAVLAILQASWGDMG